MPEDVDGVARVWAAATAARDGDDSPVPLSAARAPILEALAGGAATLVVATDPGIVAFALAVPAELSPEPTAELLYLGVDPGRWGERLGERVARALLQRLRADGYLAVELYVYADNRRAVDLYERLGCKRTDGLPSPHPRTGKAQQHFRLVLCRGP